MRDRNEILKSEAWDKNNDWNKFAVIEIWKVLVWATLIKSEFNWNLTWMHSK